jgi:hypothetical protein
MHTLGGGMCGMAWPFNPEPRHGALPSMPYQYRANCKSITACQMVFAPKLLQGSFDASGRKRRSNLIAIP